jgi:hypothetical protein
MGACRREARTEHGAHEPHSGRRHLEKFGEVTKSILAINETGQTTMEKVST